MHVMEVVRSFGRNIKLGICGSEVTPACVGYGCDQHTGLAVGQNGGLLTLMSTPHKPNGTERVRHEISKSQAPISCRPKPGAPSESQAWEEHTGMPFGNPKMSNLTCPIIVLFRGFAAFDFCGQGYYNTLPFNTQSKPK